MFSTKPLSVWFLVHHQLQSCGRAPRLRTGSLSLHLILLKYYLSSPWTPWRRLFEKSSAAPPAMWLIAVFSQPARLKSPPAFHHPRVTHGEGKQSRLTRTHFFFLFRSEKEKKRKKKKTLHTASRIVVHGEWPLLWRFPVSSGNGFFFRCDLPRLGLGGAFVRGFVLASSKASQCSFLKGKPPNWDVNNFTRHIFIPSYFLQNNVDSVPIRVCLFYRLVKPGLGFPLLYGVA